MARQWGVFYVLLIVGKRLLRACPEFHNALKVLTVGRVEVGQRKLDFTTPLRQPDEFPYSNTQCLHCSLQLHVIEARVDHITVDVWLELPPSVCATTTTNHIHGDLT